MTDKKKKKTLNNKISAYKSRLHKRMDNEQLKQQIDIRNKQIQIMIKVLRQELPEDKLQNIMGRIKNETPSIQRQGSKF